MDLVEVCGGLSSVRFGFGSAFSPTCVPTVFLML